MRLALCNWKFVENYLTESRGIIIPLGSTEQHGPGGLIGTDAICAENIAWSAADQCGALVAPTIALTPAQFNLAFPGTISVRASTLMALLEDVIASLANSGFQQFYFINGHGANIAVVRSACHDIYQSLSLSNSDQKLDFRFKSWWDFPSVDTLRKNLFADREGMHATPSEVAITQAIYPELFSESGDVEFAALPESYLRDHAGDAHVDAARHRERFADGCVGSDPSMASAEFGERLFGEAVGALIDDYLEFIDC